MLNAKLKMPDQKKEKKRKKEIPRQIHKLKTAGPPKNRIELLKYSNTHLIQNHLKGNLHSDNNLTVSVGNSV